MLGESNPDWTNLDSLNVDCPWCGETIQLLIDPSGGDHQDYIEDCEVCCRPWHISVVLGRDGNISVKANPSD